MLFQTLRREVMGQRERLPRWLRNEWFLVFALGILVFSTIVVGEMRAADYPNQDKVRWNAPLSDTLQFDIALLVTIHVLVAFRAIVAGVHAFAWNARDQMQDGTIIQGGSSTNIVIIKWLAALWQLGRWAVVLLMVWLETGFFVNVSFGGFQWPLLMSGIITFDWSKRVLLGLLLIPIFTLAELLFSTALGMAVHTFLYSTRKAIASALVLRFLPVIIFSFDDQRLIDYGTTETLTLIRPRPFGLINEHPAGFVLFVEMSIITVFLVLTLTALGLSVARLRRSRKAIRQSQPPS